MLDMHIKMNYYIDLCDTGFHPITVAKPHETNRSQRNEKTRLIIKRVIFIARRKLFSERFQREVNASGSTHRSRGPPAVRNVSTARAREKPEIFCKLPVTWAISRPPHHLGFSLST